MAVSTGSFENAGRSGRAEVARGMARGSRGGTAIRRPRRSQHEIAALLRAHLSAAAQVQRHLTPHCPVCYQLQRLALESEREARHTARETPGSEAAEELG